jgi:hypothetical protein
LHETNLKVKSIIGGLSLQAHCDRTTLEWGVHRPGLAWAILSEARTQSTYRSIQYHILSSSKSYYTLGSRIKYIKEVWSQKTLQKIFRVGGSGNTLVEYILFTLEENAIHRCSKPVDPSMAPNSHRFEPPTAIPHRHRRQEKETPQLHIGDNKSKAWATTLSKTYPSWSKDHN